MSVHAHGALTESSLRAPIGKGREGKGSGIGREGRGETSHHGVAYVKREPHDGMMTGSLGSHR